MKKLLCASLALFLTGCVINDTFSENITPNTTSDGRTLVVYSVTDGYINAWNKEGLDVKESMEVMIGLKLAKRRLCSDGWVVQSFEQKEVDMVGQIALLTVECENEK